MSGFLKRNTNTVNPAGGINPALEPNVGQYGWTSYDAGNVNQIIEYVNIVKGYADSAKNSADYVASKFDELERFIDYIEEIYNQIGPIFSNIDIIYKDITLKHTEVMNAHTDVLAAERLVLPAAEQALANAAASDVSATAAKASEVAAALSAKEAADVAEELRKGQVYRGTWNIEANAGYPAAPDTNSVWDIVLNEDSLEYNYDGQKWFWGDRLLYLKDDNKFSQIESGSTVVSVNGKSGAVQLSASDVGAVATTGGNMTGGLGVPGISFTNSEARINNSDGNEMVISTKAYGANLFGNINQDVYLVFKDFLRARHGATDYRVYHEGLKPTAEDVGALPITGGIVPGAVTVGFLGHTALPNNNPQILTASADGTVYLGNPTSVNDIRLETTTGNANVSVGSTNYRIYHQGYKPTPADVGALSITGGTLTGDVNITGPNTGINFTNINNGTSIVNGTGDGAEQDKTNLQIKSWFGVGIAPTAGNDSLTDNNLNSVWIDARSGRISTIGDIYTNTDKRVYHEGYKPTAFELGALSLKDGGVVEAEVKIKAPTTGGLSLGGGGSYAEIAPMLASSANPITEDSIRYYGPADWRIGSSDRIYHHGHKPTYSDIGALPATEDYGSFQVSKPIVATSGFVAQSTNTSLSIEANPNALPYIASKTPSESGPRQVMTFSDTTVDVKRNIQVSGGAIDIVGSESNIIQFHQPGKKAVLAYQPAGQEAFRIAGSNGGFSETVAIAQFDKDNAALIGKVSTSYSRNRSWVDKGNVAFLSQQKNVQPGFLVGHISGIGHMPGVHLTEHGLGVLYNTSFNDTAHVLWGVDEKDWTSIWQFKNGGEMSTPSGTRIEQDGNLYGAVWGGNYISSWVQFNFAPISDIKHKRIVGESKLSALGQIGKMKFHEFVWKDTDVTKQLTKRDMKLNRIGVIAQELEAIDPTYTRDIETYAEDGSVAESTKVLDTANLLAVALKAIQEQQAQINELKEKLNEYVLK